MALIVIAIPAEEDQISVIRDAFKKKKIAEKETLVHSHLTPSLPSLNGTREMGT